MFLKIYSLTILLLDVLSLVIKVLFTILEAIYHAIVGVQEKSVAGEIVLNMEKYLYICIQLGNPHTV
ncbi:hypothetical protein C0J52_17482 [Blattella germanica]|nr:hypothetical protein C0J52_17482 [Blattella germanica]